MIHTMFNSIEIAVDICLFLDSIQIGFSVFFGTVRNDSPSRKKTRIEMRQRLLTNLNCLRQR